MDNTELHIDRLSPLIQDMAVQLVNQSRYAGFPTVITSSTRTAAEQAALVRAGRSTTMNSKHLTGLAFDVDMYGWNRDAVPAWVWQFLGPLGESCGLKWGGRWTSFRDVGHFEF